MTKHSAIAPVLPRPDRLDECAHPGCAAKPQDRYPFPIPLCGRHITKVIARSVELARTAKRDHIVQNNAPLPITARDPSGKHAPVIYYLRFRDMVKIGYTTNLGKRMRAIPHDELLAVEPGTLRTETRRHSQFASARQHGEWFTLTPELAALTTTLQTKFE